jgi:hypothetical protein
MLKGFVKLFDKIDIVTGATVFDTLASILEGEGAGKDLFLTGHSLGGIIAVTFAMLLVARQEPPPPPPPASLPMKKKRYKKREA